MARTRTRLGVAGWIMVALGVCGLLGAAALAMAPGFQLSASAPFGETVSVELPAGDHAVYVTPSDEWSEISCVGEVGGQELQLRLSMIQQDLLLPERWDARGSVWVDEPDTMTVSCDGPVPGGRFAVGPMVTILSLVGPALLGAASVLGLVVGLMLLLAGRLTRAA
ncbi:hypothetical protein ACEXQB_003455 [Herbiconiux sp. P18]|uniref:hypothetical protein n=1 Tax=Herbiconiux liangxiaofengii TaxID=3342795 RepID=UPI0035BA433C